MQKENKTQLTSSRSVGMRDINALLQNAPISRIKTLRNDEGRHRNAGKVLPNNQIKCHSRKLLSGISTAFNNAQGGDPRLQASGMTTDLNDGPSSVLTGHLLPHGEASYFSAPSTWRERVECVSTGVRGIFKEAALNKNAFRAPLRSGFTLIELLVVVLIIGILVAVALPQYQKAVLKSRYATLKNNVMAISRAQEMYYLEHDTYATQFNQLAIDIGGRVADATDEKRMFDWGGCDMTIEKTRAFFGCHEDQSKMFIQIYPQHAPMYPGDMLCGIKFEETSSIQAQICKQETMSQNPTHRGEGYRAWDY